MIKKYLAHIQSKPTHERRQHAMQLATGLTALALVIWVTTLGVRFAMTPAEVAANNADASQAASVVDSAQGNATLLVATTTADYTDTGDNSGYFGQ
jgi:uncharacterized protein (DUF1684 family)